MGDRWYTLSPMSQKNQNVEVSKNADGVFFAHVGSDAAFVLAGLSSEQIAAVVAYIECRAVMGEFEVARDFHTLTPDMLLRVSGATKALRMSATKFPEYVAVYRKNIAQGETP